MDSTNLIPFYTAILTSLTALFVAWITFTLTKKREHESDWRKIKLSKYQEYIEAVSGIVGDKPNPEEAQKRYFNAIHSLMLVAPIKIYDAVILHQKETLKHPSKISLEEHNRLWSIIIREMRKDIHKSLEENQENADFHLIAYRNPETPNTK